MIRYGLLCVLMTLAGCAGKYWCVSYTNGVSRSECYPEEGACEWHRRRLQITAIDPQVSSCESYSKVYCFDAVRNGRTFEQCFPDSSECATTRDRRMEINADTHSFTECKAR